MADQKLRYVPYGGAGKMPVEQCEFSVVDETTRKEICRCWTLADAQHIAFAMNLRDAQLTFEGTRP